MSTMRRTLCVLGVALLASACVESEEAPRLSVPIVVDGDGLGAATNELGWRVEVDSARLCIQDLLFTIEGETHTARTPLERLERLFVSEATAHPGHLAGGEVTGELLGTWVVDFGADEGLPFGEATMLAGSYEGANFLFCRASASSLDSAEDPMVGHTARIAGSATKDGETISFEAVLDVDEGTWMIGAPLGVTIDPGYGSTLGLQLTVDDPFEPDTLFQKIDFGALDEDGDGAVSIEPGSPSHNILRRALQDHDQYLVTER